MLNDDAITRLESLKAVLHAAGYTLGPSEGSDAYTITASNQIHHGYGRIIDHWIMNGRGSPHMIVHLLVTH